MVVDPFDEARANTSTRSRKVCAGSRRKYGSVQLTAWPDQRLLRQTPGPADPHDGAHSTDFDGFGLQLSTCDTASCPFPQYKATQQLECAL